MHLRTEVGKMDEVKLLEAKNVVMKRQPYKLTEKTRQRLKGEVVKINKRPPYADKNLFLVYCQHNLL